MTFLAVTPASRPLVVGGLRGEGSTNESWGRLFTERPDVAVFEDRIEEESPYMRRHVRADRYDERFNVLVQVRFSTPQRLYQTTPHRARWVGSDRLRVPLEPRPEETPSEELRTAASVVTTSLCIYEHDGRTPGSVVLPVRGEDGGSIAEVVAE